MVLKHLASTFIDGKFHLNSRYIVGLTSVVFLAPVATQKWVLKVSSFCLRTRRSAS